MMKRLLFLLIAVCLLIPTSLTNSSIVQAQEIKESISVTQMGEMNNTISSPPVCDWSAENHSTTYELIKPTVAQEVLFGQVLEVVPHILILRRVYTTTGLREGITQL